MNPLFALLICLTALLAACRPTVDCQDVGCAFGQTCNTTTGACESVVFDCRNGDTCDPGDVCDQTSGECRPDALRCADGNPCPSGLVCDAGTGFCRPAFRCSLDGCPGSEICDLQTDRCVAKPCETDDGCPDLFVCVEGLCTSGCRRDATVCPSGQGCFVQTGDDYGVCRDECQEDTQCPFGQICLDEGARSSCTLEPPCNADEDCRIDETCRSSACVQPPCETDADCTASQICETPTGTCIDAQCDEDIFGDSANNRPPNHSFETAFPLAPEDDCRASDPPKCFYEDLQICPGRSDWFAVTVQTEDIVRIRVEQLALTPDLDVFVYNEDGQLIAQNRQIDPISTVRFAAERDQVVSVEIRGMTFEDARYSLTITNDFCANDMFEENDSQSSATVLSTSANAEVSGRSCGFDMDWFVLPDLSEDASLSVALVSGSPDLSIRLLTPDGKIFDARQAPVGLSRVGTAGDYHIAVQPTIGQTGTYRLAYSVAAPWACPDAGMHASSATALPVSNGVADLQICPFAGVWETDWLTIPSENGVLDLRVSPSSGAPSLSVSLLEDRGAGPSVVRAAQAVQGTLALQAPIDDGASYFVRVSSNQPLGRIVGTSTYKLEWSVTP